MFPLVQQTPYSVNYIFPAKLLRAFEIQAASVEEGHRRPEPVSVSFPSVSHLTSGAPCRIVLPEKILVSDRVTLCYNYVFPLVLFCVFYRSSLCILIDSYALYIENVDKRWFFLPRFC